MNTPPQLGKHKHEAGYVLATVVVMVALVLIALAVAAPVVARDLRREKEVESEHRALQYVRAIRLYQRKFPNQYPPSIEALEKSNNIRFLRQKYVDPLTGKADYRLIHVGQNQTTVKGFFGEPLGGLDTKGGTGLGSAAGMTSDNSGTTKVGAGGSIFGAGFVGATVGTPGSNGASGASGSTGSTGFGSGDGGGPIMGVGTSRTGSSILTPNDQSTYESWEFLYDPRIELMYKKGALNGGIGSQNASAFGQDATGAGTGKNGTGTGSGTGSTGTPGTTTPTPQ